jgi:hypothetical protein
VTTTTIVEVGVADIAAADFVVAAVVVGRQ